MLAVNYNNECVSVTSWLYCIRNTYIKKVWQYIERLVLYTILAKNSVDFLIGSEGERVLWIQNVPHQFIFTCDGEVMNIDPYLERSDKVDNWKRFLLYNLFQI
jgi:hypothetical protein